MPVQTIGRAVLVAALSTLLVVSPVHAQLGLGNQQLPHVRMVPSPVFPNAAPYYAPPPQPTYQSPAFQPSVPQYLAPNVGGVAGGTFNPSRY